MRRTTIYTILLLALPIAIGSGIFAWKSLSQRQNVLSTPVVSAPSTGSHASTSSAAAFPDESTTPSATAVTAPIVPPAGYLHYSNPKYHFSLWYPPNLKVQDYPESGGERTISFQSADYSQGFEVFIVPYDQPQISKIRFQMDEPSGVMPSPQQVSIDGAPATMFFGQNDIMGPTREVWFIHGGYLYEVTTYKPLDSWLSQILATWQFI